MTKTTSKIRCVNKRCKTLNLLEDTFCSRCHIPVVKRYLRIHGTLAKEYHIGELIEDRFLLCHPDIVIDTKPDLLPILPDSVSEEITCYLKLFSHRLHIPQIYGYVDQQYSALLLEYESVPIDDKGHLIYPNLFATIESSFEKASTLRQVNWLWQMVILWKPLAKQKVLSSFFKPNNIRVSGGIVKLIELTSDDNENNPNLKDLADLWSHWIPYLNPLIQDIISNIILSLQENLIKTPTKILAILDQVLYLLGNNFYRRKYQIITATDAGKKRGNNEDACYPETNILKETRSGIDTLAIVCDGLGGQEAGEVASNLAIEIIQKELENDYKKTLKETLQNKHWTPLIDAEKIHNAVKKANDKINQINNTEKRHERQRMGTTVVITMAIAHEVYLSHVGDSRIYWITSDSCHQVTVDDDLATRETRLGYGFYREVVKNPQTGALLQALGMNSSQKLKVHIRRFVLDEDCVFLLCSDGLSDFDRVEQYWTSEIIPIIKGEITIEDAAKKILNIGINKNGHDNVTIGLVYCQLEEKKPEEYESPLSWEYLQEIIPNLPKPQGKINIEKPDNISNENKVNFALDKSKIIIIAFIICLGLGFFFWYQNKSSQNKSSRISIIFSKNLTSPKT
ncbi:PP2C family serine/threonine-protein phosphatase [Geminocystis sp.]|uniref:PP2C family protein-serine/threonine phosphatase n=1 Tax=Geminocystis sp. TaxID=2664100 RepID=UPI003594339A